MREERGRKEARGCGAHDQVKYDEDVMRISNMKNQRSRPAPEKCFHSINTAFLPGSRGRRARTREKRICGAWKAMLCLRVSGTTGNYPVTDL